MSSPIVVVSPVIGWEEKQLLRAATELGIAATHVSPEAVQSYLLPGEARVQPSALVPGATVLMRCPSYFASIEVAAALERHGLRTYNSSAQLTLFGRKTLTDAWLFGHRMPQVPSCIAFSAAGLDDIVQALGLPLVVKPSVGGFGRRVHLVPSAAALRQIWDYLEDFAPAYHQQLYVQRALDVAHDVRVNVLEGRVLASNERVNDASFAKNIAQGGSGRPFDLAGRAKEIADELCRLLPRGFFGIDLLVDTKGAVFVCEVNASCSFREATKVSGKDIALEVVRAAAGAVGAEASP